MAEPVVNIVEVKPYDKTNVLIPAVTKRMLEMARLHSPEMRPEKIVQAYLTRLYSGDPTVKIVALVTSDYKVVGHACASLESDGVDNNARKWVFIQQIKADENVGDAVDRCLELAEAWGRVYGCSYIMLGTHRNDEAMRRRFGAKTHRYIMGKPILPEGTEVVERTESDSN
jgi:hypothetical protein